MRWDDEPSFIGRGEELEEMEQRLAGGGVVALVGMAGMGKSRLARQWRPAAPFVDLAGVEDREALRSHVARVLGLPPPRTAGWLPAGALEQRGVGALVFDACEGIVQEALALALRLREELPALRCVLTSRSERGLAPEQVLRVGPLPGDQASALFRAQAEAIGVVFDAGERALVESLVARLDGVPGSLRLFARRLSVMDLTALEARVGETLDGASPLPRRLEQALRLSLALLSPEQHGLARLVAVFAGAPTLSDLEQVADDAGLPFARDLPELVDELLQLSWLVREVEPGEPPHFRLLRVARPLLEAGPADETLLRSHARLFCGRVEALAPAWEGEEPASTEALRRDHAELSLAVERTLSSSPELSLLAAVGVARWAWLSGASHGALTLLERSLAASESTGVSSLRARALLWSSLLRRSRGEMERAERCLDAARALADELHDPCLRGASALHLGGLRYAQRRLADARRLLEQGVETLAGTSGGYLRAMGMADLGMLRHEQGDEAGAAAALSEARVDAESWPALCARVLQAWANHRLELGSFEDARDALERSHRLAREQRASHLALRAAVDLGATAQLMGDLERAEADLREAALEARRAGLVRVAARARGQLAAVLLERGVAEAREEARAAAEEAARGGDPRATTAFRALWMAAACMDDDLESAQVVLGRIERDVEALTDPVSQRLGRLARSWAHSVGVRMTEPSPAPDLQPPRSLLGRVVGRSLDAAAQRLGVAGSSSSGDEGCLWVESAGAALSFGPRRVACFGRNTRRLLIVLARARVDQPGTFLPAQTLTERVWAGEQLRGRSGINRLHVTLSKLRALGLKPYLEREGTGYRLSPALALRMVAAGALSDDA